MSNRKNATEEKSECELPTEIMAIQRKGKANKQKTSKYFFSFLKRKKNKLKKKKIIQLALHPPAFELDKEEEEAQTEGNHC